MTLYQYLAVMARRSCNYLSLACDDVAYRDNVQKLPFLFFFLKKLLARRICFAGIIKRRL